MNKTKVLGPLTVAALGLGSLSLAACTPKAPDPTPVTTTATQTATQTTEPTPSETPSSTPSGHPSASASPTRHGSASASPSSSSDGATQTVQGSGYKFDVPANWVKVSQPTVETAYKDPQQTNGFFTNAVTSVEDDRGASLDENTQAAVQQMEKLGITDVQQGTTTLDGEEATTLEFTRTVQNVSVRQRQVLSVHEHKLYNLTVSINGQATDDEFDDVIDPMMDSWQWA